MRGVLLKLDDLPGLTRCGLESSIVERCTHHSGHAWRPVEEIKEGLLCNMVQVHFVCL